MQGALCSCFSGQCYFSSFAGNNSGNRGRCKQPCRKLYSIDRKGFEERAYALSLSDLSVGERVKELLQAGVTSLKIEGSDAAGGVRLGGGRLLPCHSGRGGEKRALAARSALARTFDRGDYTEGLAFGQENLLSRNVQGHIGERVGVLEVRGGRYLLPRGAARKGDGFKILRGGKEAGRRRVRLGGRAGILPLFREQAARGRRGAHHDGHRAQRGASQKRAVAGSGAFPALCGGRTAADALRLLRDDGRRSVGSCGTRAPFPKKNSKLASTRRIRCPFW